MKFKSRRTNSSSSSSTSSSSKKEILVIDLDADNCDAVEGEDGHRQQQQKQHMEKKEEREAKDRDAVEEMRRKWYAVRDQYAVERIQLAVERAQRMKRRWGVAMAEDEEEEEEDEVEKESKEQEAEKMKKGKKTREMEEHAVASSPSKSASDTANGGDGAAGNDNGEKEEVEDDNVSLDLNEDLADDDKSSPTSLAVEKLVPLELTGMQKMLFWLLLDRIILQLTPNHPSSMANLLTALKRNCTHPHLVCKDIPGMLYSMNLIRAIDAKRNFYVECSAKFLYLKDILERKEKVVIVARETETLNLLAVLLRITQTNFLHTLATDNEKSVMETMNNFTSSKNDKQALLLPEVCVDVPSTALCVVKHVVLMDGPSMRIPFGLTQDTTVYQLVSKGSYEQALLLELSTRLAMPRLTVSQLETEYLESYLVKIIEHLRKIGDEKLNVTAAPLLWEPISPDMVQKELTEMASRHHKITAMQTQQLLSHLEQLVIQQSVILRKLDGIVKEKDEDVEVRERFRTRVLSLIQRCCGPCRRCFSKEQGIRLDRWLSMVPADTPTMVKWIKGRTNFSWIKSN